MTLDCVHMQVLRILSIVLCVKLLKPPARHKAHTANVAVNYCALSLNLFETKRLSLQYLTGTWTETSEDVCVVYFDPCSMQAHAIMIWSAVGSSHDDDEYAGAAKHNEETRLR
jgi:hypothetical protein